jgi:hypothetical protein
MLGVDAPYERFVVVVLHRDLGSVTGEVETRIPNIRSIVKKIGRAEPNACGPPPTFGASSPYPRSK